MLITDRLVLSDEDVSGEETLGVDVNAVSTLSTESGKLRSISRIRDSKKEIS